MLTPLEMGMVSVLFEANVDGSFTSSLSLLSLEAMDGATPRHVLADNMPQPAEGTLGEGARILVPAKEGQRGGTRSWC